MVFELPKKGKNRSNELEAFADNLIMLQRQIGFKMSSRGWCYLLENKGLITKDQFDKCEKLVNECRRDGYIPIDFVLQDVSRTFDGIEIPESRTPEEFLTSYLLADLDAWRSYTPDWWQDEQYYIQLVVEKIDLKTLFTPVCKTFHIPIANAKGWSSMLMRALFAKRFKEAEEDGKTAVLLYCGDHDPAGLNISKFLMENLQQISRVTWEDGKSAYDPSNLIIDRFGLNYDFIEANNLMWINNLITGSGKNLADPSHKDFHKSYVQNYLRDIGERKCEANALVVIAEKARLMCRKAIEKYLGPHAEMRFWQKQQSVKDSFDTMLDETRIRQKLIDALHILEERMKEQN